MKTLVRRQRPIWGDFPLLFDDFFGDEKGFNFNSKTPAVNIQESESQFNLELAVPGFKKEDFEVKVEQDRLVVSAESKVENEVEQGHFTRKEFGYHSFERAFQLPKDTVDQSKIDAKYEAGILKVVVPKKKEVLDASARRIEIG